MFTVELIAVALFVGTGLGYVTYKAAKARAARLAAKAKAVVKEVEKKL